jgi:uncharacterized protein (TIGR03000 family)
MIPRFSSIVRVPALAAIALLTTAVMLAASGIALAESDRTYYDATGYWRYYNGYWYHYKSYVHGYNAGYYARPDRVLPHGVSPAHYGAYSFPGRPTGPGYASQRPGPTIIRPHTESTQAESASTAMPVHIEIRVAPDAEIWFDDAKTTQSGTVREFVSPPMSPGRDYTYEIRARWKVDGNEVSQNRRITVHAGEQVSISFAEPVQAKTK